MVSELSDRCQKGFHAIRDWPGQSYKGCYGVARDKRDGHYFDHPCRCECHLKEPTHD